jgi:hypothetical protein
MDQILFLQRTIGNQAVQRLFKSGHLQAKQIGAPNDIYEQEAGRGCQRGYAHARTCNQMKPT